MKYISFQGFVGLAFVIAVMARDSTACDNDEFTCDDGGCVPRNAWCDSETDCEDDSDEEYCDKKSYFNSDPNGCKTKPNLFLCKNGHCYPTSVRCDGFEDCDDGSDEAGCTTTAGLISVTTAIPGAKTTAAIVASEDDDDQDDDSRGIEVEDDMEVNLIDIDDNDSFSDNVRKGLKWLLSVRKPNYGWGPGTARALVALGLAKPNVFTKPFEDANLMKKQLQIQVAIDFVRNYTQPVSLSRLSLYINSMLATCQDPRSFHGLNLVRDLRHRTMSAYRQKTGFVNPVALLTLCLVGESTESDVHKLMETIRVRAEEQRWIDMQYISVMALACIVQNHPFGRAYADRLQTAVAQVLERKSEEDGSFGNIYSTALAVQAILSARGKSGWRAEQSLRFLANQQLDTGSFGDLLSTYYILPVLVNTSLTNLKGSVCTKGDTPPKETKLVPLETLLDYQGSRHYIRYSLYYGNPVDVSYSVLLHVPLNTTFFDIMRLAEHTDPKFKFQYEKEQNKGISVYSIGSVPNDAEKGHYWQLYANLNSRHSRQERHGLERISGGVNLQRYMHGVAHLIPKSGDHIAFWYRPINE